MTHALDESGDGLNDVFLKDKDPSCKLTFESYSNASKVIYRARVMGKYRIRNIFRWKVAFKLDRRIVREDISNVCSSLTNR